MQWYTDPNARAEVLARIQFVGVLVQAFSALITAAGVTVALFQDRIRERLKDRPKLSLSFENDSNHCHGWIRKVAAPFSERTKVHFYRAKIANEGRCPAESVVLTLGRIEYVDTKQTSREPIMSLRWADNWSFILDGSQSSVLSNAGSSPTVLQALPAGMFKYCDLCFLVDASDSHSIGRDLFEKGRVYFAVDNLPSASLTLQSGSYVLDLYLSASNAAPLKVRVEMEVNLAKEDPSKMVHLKTIQG